MTATREGDGRTVLITGASAGIGAALARVFAANGFHLVLTARRAERLAALAEELRQAHGAQTHTIIADLARPEACAKLVSELEARNIVIDALVNNAGYGLSGDFHEKSWPEIEDFLRVLVAAPSELTHRLLPSMRARKFGRILNVASVAGLLPGTAGDSLYGGAKALMIKASRGLQAELQGTGIFVCALCPGLTYSEFHDANGTRAEMNRLPKFLWLSAERVAEEGYRALMRNDAVYIPGLRYRLICRFAPLSPPFLMRIVARARRVSKRL